MSMKGPVLEKEFKKQFMSLLVKDFNWSQRTAIALKAILNGQNVVAIIDTGSSGVVVSCGCVVWLGIQQDKKVEINIA